jgi:hypothetical protein
MQDSASRTAADNGRADTAFPNLFSCGNDMFTALVHLGNDSLCYQSFLPNNRLGFRLRNFGMDERNFLFSESTLRFLSGNA